MKKMKKTAKFNMKKRMFVKLILKKLNKIFKNYFFHIMINYNNDNRQRNNLL